MTTIGFSGSRFPEDCHKLLISEVLNELDADHYVTGACIGVDHFVGRYLALKQPTKKHTVIVPANRLRIAIWWIMEFPFINVIEMPSGTTYRDRDYAIVEFPIDQLITFPQYPEKDPRSFHSGTWLTTRIARRANVPIRTFVLNAS